MTLRNLSDKEIKTINGGVKLFTFCGYECGYSFILTSSILSTLENVQDIFDRMENLTPTRPTPY